MSVKERIIRFIRSLSISQRAFEREIGLSNGYVNNIRKSIQPDKLQKIALCYPNLNTGWLMTGEGPMLRPVEEKGTASQALREPQAVAAKCAACEERERIIASKDKQVEALERVIISKDEILLMKDQMLEMQAKRIAELEDFKKIQEQQAFKQKRA